MGTWPGYRKVGELQATRILVDERLKLKKKESPKVKLNFDLTSIVAGWKEKNAILVTCLKVSKYLATKATSQTKAKISASNQLVINWISKRKDITKIYWIFWFSFSFLRAAFPPKNSNTCVVWGEGNYIRKIEKLSLPRYSPALYIGQQSYFLLDPGKSPFGVFCCIFCPIFCFVFFAKK